MWGFQIPWQDVKGGTLYLLFIKKSLPIIFFSCKGTMCFGEIWKIETNEKKRKIPRSPWPSIVSIWYTSFRVSDFFYITLKTREWDHTVDTDLQPAVYRLIIVGAYAHAVTHFSPAWRNVNQSVGGGDFRELMWAAASPGTRRRCVCRLCLSPVLALSLADPSRLRALSRRRIEGQCASLSLPLTMKGTTQTITCAPKSCESVLYDRQADPREGGMGGWW